MVEHKLNSIIEKHLLFYISHTLHIHHYQSPIDFPDDFRFRENIQEIQAPTRFELVHEIHLLLHEQFT